MLAYQYVFWRKLWACEVLKNFGNCHQAIPSADNLFFLISWININLCEKNFKVVSPKSCFYKPITKQEVNDQWRLFWQFILFVFGKNIPAKLHFWQFHQINNFLWLSKHNEKWVTVWCSLPSLSLSEKLSILPSCKFSLWSHLSQIHSYILQFFPVGKYYQNINLHSFFYGTKKSMKKSKKVFVKGRSADRNGMNEQILNWVGVRGSLLLL